jgi:pimeloyl-ACP methyl ester carboxylesterase
MNRGVVIVVGLLSLSWLNVSAENWHAVLGELVNSADGVNRDSLIARIESARPDWHEVMTELTWLSFPDTTRNQVLRGASLCDDGIVRPYALYVPSDYNPKIATPLLVHLHGIVGRPNIETDLNTYVGDSAIMSVAEQRGWLVLFPFGHQGATWWDKVGMNNVMTKIRVLKKKFNIDDDRVFLSGISDGASAAFLYAMVRPDDFAAYAALNGSMGVGSEDGGFSTYAPNLSNTYVYATTASRDKYYPTSQMQRAIRMARQAGARIYHHQLEGEHISSIFTYDYAAMFDSLQQHPRSPFPQSIYWETATPDYGTCRWLRIDEVTIDDPAHWYVDYNVALVDSMLSLGLIPFDTCTGPGVRVASVSDGDFVARYAGVQPSDIIIGGNGVTVNSGADLGKLKATFRYGAEVTIDVKRGDSMFTLHGRVPRPKTFYIFRREKPSAVIKASYDNNRFELRTSRVGSLTIRISPDMVDLDRPVQVFVDGQPIVDAKVLPDIAYMLRAFIANRDRRVVYVNELQLVLAE